MTHSAPIYQYWRVNGTAFAQLPSDIRDDLDTGQVTNEGNEEFYLIIPGRAEYNGTTLQCVAGGGGVERESENATLNIQGIHVHVRVRIHTCGTVHEHEITAFRLYSVGYSYVHVHVHMVTLS